jgi:hypothetical protein
MQNVQKVFIPLSSIFATFLLFFAVNGTQERAGVLKKNLNREIASDSPASTDSPSDRNKSDLPTGIFSNPPEGGFFQIAAGVSDATIATYLVRSATSSATVIPIEAQMINDAREDLARAHKWPTTQSAKVDLIKVREAHVEKIREILAASNGRSVYTKADLKKAGIALQEVREMTVMSEKAKALMVANAEKSLSESRAAGLEAIAARSGKFAKSMRALRVIGGTLFMADALGRIYVWHVMDANPTLTPAGSVFKHYTYDQIKDLLLNSKTSEVVLDASVPENKSGGSTNAFLNEFETAHELHQ